MRTVARPDRIYQVTVTSKGQITFPRALQRHVGLRAGDPVAIDVDDEHIIFTFPRSRSRREIQEHLPS